MQEVQIKTIKQESSTIRFAYASVAATKDILKGQNYQKNIFPRRPGIGDFLAKDYKMLIGKQHE